MNLVLRLLDQVKHDGCFPTKEVRWQALKVIDGLLNAGSITPRGVTQ